MKIGQLITLRNDISVSETPSKSQMILDFLKNPVLCVLFSKEFIFSCF